MAAPTSQTVDPPRVHQTDDQDTPPVSRIKKRIIVCCDGTWQDGVSTKYRSMYTNILRIARTIQHEDTRFNPSIPQVVFYQSGIGSEGGFYAEFVEGTTGATLGNKVEEAYAFIAHNYCPGDEVFLFGFSRGAYTARMIAMFIGAIGILDRRDMDHFSKIFVAYQTLAKSKDEDEIHKVKAELAPFTDEKSPGKLRAHAGDRKFSVKCVGVFDTVGSVGLPEELTLKPKVKKIFGFPDKILGEHIERAYHALALNETRKDFDCAKFEQTESGRRKGQLLEQCWFTGSHSDIGAGYRFHDLSDLTLTWMVAHVSDILAMDLDYLASLPKPVAPWGEQKPHDPATGIFSLAFQIKRTIPTSRNEVTKETYHPSVLQQKELDPEISKIVSEHPDMVAELKPLEKGVRSSWSVDEVNAMKMLKSEENKGQSSITGSIIKALGNLVDSDG